MIRARPRSTYLRWRCDGDRRCGHRHAIDGLRSKLAPGDQAIAIANRDRTVARFADLHRAARRHPAARARELQQAIAVADDPVIGQRPRLLDDEHPIEETQRWTTPMKVLTRRRRSREPRIVLDEIAAGHERIGRSVIGDPGAPQLLD